ncbi:MAG TPA: carbohydrate ABC transporter permease [Firmicutes bacterium]|nr:carbohydrate ABC transporter permease [Bacillota bacterium]
MPSQVTVDWKIRKRRREMLAQLFAHLVLIAGAVIFAFPFVWLVSTSLKPDDQLFLFPPTFIPRPVRWDNYTRMLQYLPFFQFLKNTLYVTVLNVIGTLLSCSLVAYGFARLRFPGRDILFLVLLSTMMLPPQVTMVPVYLIFKRLGWVDTFKPLYINSFFGIPFFIFLLRQFMTTIPYEIEDSAKIDGCGYLRLYGTIILPLIKPALATVAIFRAMNSWNDFLTPLIYLNSVNKMTLALGLRLFQNMYGGEWSLMMAASTLMTLPIIVLFFFSQRQFIQGITLTGLKG